MRTVAQLVFAVPGAARIGGGNSGRCFVVGIRAEYCLCGAFPRLVLDDGGTPLSLVR
jgi:hypothetical protein